MCRANSWRIVPRRTPTVDDTPGDSPAEVDAVGWEPSVADTARRGVRIDDATDATGGCVGGD